MSQTRVSTLLKLAVDNGLIIRAIEVSADGSIRLLTGGKEDAPLTALQQWEADVAQRHASRAKQGQAKAR